MRKLALTVALMGAAAPAMAASEEGPFFSLGNTDYAVLVAFLIFAAVIVYFRVPSLIGGMLDKRADTIRNDLDEARALREEAQTVLADFERKQQDVKLQAASIVDQAKADAQAAADQAKIDLEKSIERRLKNAEEQIASAEAAAVKEVRDRAVTIAIAAAAQVVSKGMTKADSSKMIDEGIQVAAARLN